jgi:hypothetical protein
MPSELIRPSLPANASVEEIRRAIKLTSDNISRINERLRGWDYELTHGAELLVEKPVNYVVTKALAVRSYDLTTGAEGLPVESLTVREVTPTTLGLTAYYRYARSSEMLTRRNSAAQSVAAGDQTIVYDTEDVRVGTGISYSGGTFTVAESGLYQVNVSYHYDGDGAIYDDVRTSITGSGQDYWSIGYGAPAGGARVPQQLSHALYLAAGGTIIIKTNHGAVGSRTIGNTAGDSRFQSRVSIARMDRISDQETGSYRVTVMLLD